MRASVDKPIQQKYEDLQKSIIKEKAMPKGSISEPVNVNQPEEIKAVQLEEEVKQLRPIKELTAREIKRREYQKRKKQEKKLKKRQEMENA